MHSDFTADPVEDTNLQIELENEFRNKEVEDRKEQLKVSKELQKVKEIQEIADSDLSLPNDVNPFSDEGKACLNSQAVNYKGGFRALVQDSRMAKEDLKQGEVMACLEQIAEDALEKFRDIDPNDTDMFMKLAQKEIREKVNDVFKKNPKLDAKKMDKIVKNIQKQVLKARGLFVRTRKKRSDAGIPRKKRSRLVSAEVGAGFEEEEKEEKKSLKFFHRQTDYRY